MPYIRHKNADLYYEKKGNWEAHHFPIVLLHGNGESMETFDATIAPLLDRLPFLAIDSRGQGKSEILNDNYDFTYELFAEDVFAVITELGINQFDIVGFSDGGIVALLLASSEQTRMHVSRMIVIGANLEPKGMKHFMLSRISHEKRMADVHHDPLQSALCRLMLNEPHITADDLSRIYACTAVVVGSNDIIKPAHTEFIADSIIHARLRVVDGADHMIPQKFPERLREIITDELD